MKTGVFVPFQASVIVLLFSLYIYLNFVKKKRLGSFIVILQEPNKAVLTIFGGSQIV